MKWIKALGALAVLAALVIGPPALLIGFVGNPWPAEGVSLMAPLTDGAIIGVLAAILWLFWAQMVVCIIVEAVAVARATRLNIRVPATFGFQQHLAQALVAAVVLVLAGGAMTSGASHATANTAPAAATSSVMSTIVAASETTTEETTSDQQTTNEADKVDDAPTVTVHRGDTLWSLAIKHLGDGERWQEIADANEGKEMRGGGTFRGSVVIQPGWELQLPGDAIVTKDSGQVTIEKGDTLSQIALDELGDANKYPEIFEASKDIKQPGGRHLSDPDVIEPGWTVQLPGHAAAEEAPAPMEEPASKQEQPAAPAPVEGPPVAQQAPQAPSEAAPQAEGQETDQASADTDKALDEEEGGWPVRTAGGIGAVLAAGLIALLALRRRRQQQHRKPGQSIPLPTDDAANLETEVRAVADVDQTAALDEVLRDLATSYAEDGRPLPTVQAVRLSEGRVELYLATPDTLPAPWADIAGGNAWARQLDRISGVQDMPAPYPTLVTVGSDEEDGTVLLNVEQHGSIGVDASDPWPVMAAMVVELSTSPWSQELLVTVCGGWRELEDLLPADRMRYVPSIENLTPSAGRPELLVVVNHDAANPAITGLIGDNVSLIHAGTEGGKWGLTLTSPTTGSVRPMGLSVTPQQINDEDYPRIVEILKSSLQEPTEMSQRPSLTSVELDDSNHTEHEAIAYPEEGGEDLDNGHGRQTGGSVDELLPSTASPYSGTVTIDRPTQTLPADTEVADQVDLTEEAPATPSPVETGHPVLRILGPTVDLAGVGAFPDEQGRTSHRGVCLRIALFLALNPNTTKQQLRDGVWGGARVTSNTVAQRVSKLRAWLGENPETGAMYLPPRSLRLDDAIKTDWDIFTTMVGNPAKAATSALEDALRMVTGRPLEGETAKHFAFAEFETQHMISGVVDAAYELARRRYMDGNWRGVEEAAAIGVKFEPGTERLWRIWIHAAHSAGNPPAVTEAIDRMHARISELGFDLEPETLELIEALQSHDDDAINQGREAL